MAEFRISLHPAQAAVHNSKARFKVLAAGRRFGKSHFDAITAGVAALSTHNAKGHVLTSQHPVYYVAPTFDQAVRIMRPKLIQILKWEKQGGFIANENINNGWMELVNGVKIYLKGAENDDALRGEGNRLVILDEYASMAPHVWPEILEPTLIDVEGEALFTGTPKGKNHFYRLFMNALTRPTEYWNDWEAFHFTSHDNPFVKEQELKRLAQRRGQSSDGIDSKDIVKQEIEADFISGGNKVLVPDNFPIVKSFDSRSARYFITVDLAGFKKAEGNKILRSDESVIAITACNNEQWTVVKIEHGHWGVRETALRIVQASKNFPGSRLGIEEGALKEAVGPYLEEYMREFNRYVNPEPLRHNNTRKQDRISWALAGRSERGLIHLLSDDADGADGRQIQKWNQWFLDQAADFPDPLAHDDGLDAVAYVDQLNQASYVDASDVSEWEALDSDAGY